MVKIFLKAFEVIRDWDAEKICDSSIGDRSVAGHRNEGNGKFKLLLPVAGL